MVGHHFADYGYVVVVIRSVGIWLCECLPYGMVSCVFGRPCVCKRVRACVSKRKNLTTDYEIIRWLAFAVAFITINTLAVISPLIGIYR